MIDLEIAEFRDYLGNRSRGKRDADNKGSQFDSPQTGEAVMFGSIPREETMAKVTKLMVGESLVGEGNEVAHIDLIIGPRGSPAETAFANTLTNNKDGFTSLLAVVAPNLQAKPNTVMFNKVTIKGAKQAVQMFGPAQYAVAKAVSDSVADGTIPADEADDLFICVGVFIHWEAADDKKIQDYNYRATKEAIERAVSGKPSAAEVVRQRETAKHPFAA
jgi:5,6,7,8-tetrahydromethanopterin hydro-lyase